mgnify:CR=1 FL=1
MNKNNLIISNLEKLKISYLDDESKKWNIRALNIAIKNLKEYPDEIKSGEEIKNKIKGIGDKISKRIDEIIEYGCLKEIENLNLEENSYNELMTIIGVGKSRVKEWLKLGIKNIDDLKKNIKENNVKITKNIELGLKYYEDMKSRIPKAEISNMELLIKKYINELNNELIYQICGSYRRKNDDSGDIDLLISHPKYTNENKDYNFLSKIINSFKKNNFIIDDLSKGNKKFMGFCKLNKESLARRIDILYIDYKSYYSSVLYFTGNKYFNLHIRQKLLQKKMSLNEYYLKNLENNEIIYLKSEKEIFDILNMDYLEPFERNYRNS